MKPNVVHKRITRLRNQFNWQSIIYFFDGLLNLLGLRSDVFPGVVLLSRRR
jgi:hypothetical protein